MEKLDELIKLARPVIPKNWNLSYECSDVIHRLQILNIQLLDISREQGEYEAFEDENFGEAGLIKVWPRTQDCYYTEVKLNLLMMDFYFGKGNYFETLIHELAHVAVQRYRMSLCDRFDRDQYFLKNIIDQPMHGPLFIKALKTMIQRVEKVHGRDCVSDWSDPELYSDERGT